MVIDAMVTSAGLYKVKEELESVSCNVQVFYYSLHCFAPKE